MDVVIVRENEEDLYAGIEYRQTGDVMQCLKLITRPGCERIVRYAFAYARRNGRQQGHVLHQGQHHEADRRPLPQGLRRGRRRSSPTSPTSTGSWTSARPSWPTPRELRRRRHTQPLRRHPVRRGRADRRLRRARRLREHRPAVRHVRSDPRLRSAAGGAERGEPLRPAAGRRDDAGPHRPGRRRPSASTTPGSARSRTASIPTTSSRRASAGRRSAPASSPLRSWRGWAGSPKRSNR